MTVISICAAAPACGLGVASWWPEVDGAGDPVHTDGVVPGVDVACWGDEHALTRATNVTAATFRPAGIGIAESLA
jgi:hypothetical protein